MLYYVLDPYRIKTSVECPWFIQGLHSGKTHVIKMSTVSLKNKFSLKNKYKVGFT